ncbi:glutaredoxin domain-containing cysteine-rich protein 1 [Dioscorea alata]|uniref:Glutaredoxin domain-containing cysteine-rich protein 1 n=1 Tax=Dioscorea alata TaxID=55571 RepID=A0ACB7VMJ5_DIOAL|nr:glutaredoxin domain-containing cysteine-rich protein 1 [Dioscorea alata]
MKGVKGRLLKKLKYFSDEEKENIKPPLPKRKDLGAKNQDLEVFRRPDLNSSTLFDPGLLAAFQEALMDYKDVVLDDRDEEQGLDDVVPLMDYKVRILETRDKGQQEEDVSLMDNEGIITDPRDDKQTDDSLMEYKGGIFDFIDEGLEGAEVPLTENKDTILDVRDEEQGDDVPLREYKDTILDVRDEEEAEEEGDDVPLMECKDTILDVRDEEEEGDEVPLMEVKDDEQEGDDISLMEFEERCPPGWMGSVILYTTSLRGIRKTFEECSSLKFLLRSLKVMFYERDVSMHMEFREELWRVLGGRAIPPRLFIKGRYIGGADEVLGLHEQGKLRTLLKGLPVDCSNGGVCEECGGMMFWVCSSCHGSRKKVIGDEVLQCFQCNENGLVLCSLCC